VNRRIGKGRPVDWKDSEKFKGNICYGGLVETLRASHLVGSVLQGDAPQTFFDEWIFEVMGMNQQSWTFGTSACLLLDWALFSVCSFLFWGEGSGGNQILVFKLTCRSWCICF